MKIKKIVLDIKGKEVSMTLDEAKELRDELGKLVEKEYTYPNYPDFYREPYGSPFWYYAPTTTCGSVTLSSIN